MRTFTMGHDATKLTYKIQKIGQDIDITITGGKAHIGCIAVISNQSYNIIKIENHREDEMIKPIVKELTKEKTPTIVLKAGFHLDDITPQQITEVLQNNKQSIETIKKYINS